MIEFMLPDPSMKGFGFDLEGRTSEILCSNSNVCGASDATVDFRKAQTALFGPFLGVPTFEDLRVDEDHVLFPFLTSIADENLYGMACLRGGKSDPVAVMHDFDHFTHHALKVLVEIDDLLGLLAKDFSGMDHES